MKMTVFRRTAAIMIACAASPLMAQSFANIAQMENGLIARLGASIGEPGGPVAPIDRRLKLASCPEAITFDPPNLGAAAVRCPSLGWRIRVPLVRGGFSAATGAGAAEAQSEIVIRKGDPVEVVAGGRYFSVSSQAIAEQDGRVGGRIRVRRDAKAAPLMVEVVREGIVRVPGS